MEADLQTQVLQEMADHPAWQLFQAHLDKLCRTKDRAKASALRRNDMFEATKEQFEIDGINMALKSMTTLMQSTPKETGDE